MHFVKPITTTTAKNSSNKVVQEVSLDDQASLQESAQDNYYTKPKTIANVAGKSSKVTLRNYPYNLNNNTIKKDVKD